MEFEEKKVAKMVAQDVNGTLIGRWCDGMLPRASMHSGLELCLNFCCSWDSWCCIWYKHLIAGGKKRNFYHDDMWNIKYLKGFKWRHLTEKLGTKHAKT